MSFAISAEFERIEEAENAANIIKRRLDTEKFTITKPKYKNTAVSPFVLPYPPVYGMDDDILLPKGYGYGTKSGYFEPSLSEKCELHFIAENKAEATKILHNSGATKISSVIQ